jgi:hypothetical protein
MRMPVGQTQRCISKRRAQFLITHPSVCLHQQLTQASSMNTKTLVSYVQYHSTACAGCIQVVKA